MAATRLIALHVNKGKSVAQCLRAGQIMYRIPRKRTMENLSLPTSATL